MTSVGQCPFDASGLVSLNSLGKGVQYSWSMSPSPSSPSITSAEWGYLQRPLLHERGIWRLVGTTAAAQARPARAALRGVGAKGGSQAREGRTPLEGSGYAPRERNGAGRPDSDGSVSHARSGKEISAREHTSRPARKKRSRGQSSRGHAHKRGRGIRATRAVTHDRGAGSVPASRTGSQHSLRHRLYNRRPGGWAVPIH